VCKRPYGKKIYVYYKDMYVVWWCPVPGKSTQNAISIDRWGEKEALRRAIELRDRKYKEALEWRYSDGR
jgi:hypothetical protein